MGLTVSAKGMSAEDGFDCDYITFANFRCELASLLDDEFGKSYKRWTFGLKFTERDVYVLNNKNNPDLDIFLQHSDYEGKLSPKECRKIYKVIKDFHSDMVGHNYGVIETYNMIEHWKKMFEYSFKNRRCLFFT